MKIFAKKIIIRILQAEARLALWRYSPKIVALTGSIGKTSTKDAVFTMLSGIDFVRKSEKSYNSEIGLPLAVLGIPNAGGSFLKWLFNILKGFWLFVWRQRYPNWLVLEVGIRKPGDMRRHTSWLKTDAVIITAMGETPAHIEFFDSRRHLAEEKSGLIKTLKKNGFLILNGDDKTVLEMREKTKNRVITFGFNEGSDVRASGDNILYAKGGVPEGMIFRIDEGGSSLPVTIDGAFGRNHIFASLAALSLASVLKINKLDAATRLKKYSIPPGRMRFLNGMGGSYIIDDSYNSSPFACQSALKTLGEMKRIGLAESAGRKIAVLGDMLELGRYTEETHKDVGRIAKENLNGENDVLVIVGPRAKKIKEGAMAEGMDEARVFEFSDSREAGGFLKNFVKENDLVLVKGSQAMRMERAVEMIMLDKENKSTLLVRQEREWLDRR